MPSCAQIMSGRTSIAVTTEKKPFALVGLAFIAHAVFVEPRWAGEVIGDAHVKPRAWLTSGGRRMARSR